MLHYRSVPISFEINRVAQRHQDGCRRIIFGFSALQVVLDGLFESLLVGTDDLADLLAVLEEHERGHGADTELLGDVGDLVDVNLVEVDLVLELGRFGELDEFGGDDLAWSAPGGEAVDHDEFVAAGVVHGGAEGGFAVEGVNTISFCRGSLSSLFTQLGLMVGYVLCEIVDRHFASGLCEVVGFGCCEEAGICCSKWGGSCCD